jgi:hypothetical protein
VESRNDGLERELQSVLIWESREIPMATTNDMNEIKT